MVQALIDVNVEEQAEAHGSKPLYYQKINIKRAKPDALLGIARKLLLSSEGKALQKRININCSSPVRTKTDQYFFVNIKSDSWMIHQAGPNSAWIANSR